MYVHTYKNIIFISRCVYLISRVSSYKFYKLYFLLVITSPQYLFTFEHIYNILFFSHIYIYNHITIFTFFFRNLNIGIHSIYVCPLRIWFLII